MFIVETRQSIATEKAYGLRSKKSLDILIGSYCLLVKSWHWYCLIYVQRVVECPHSKTVRCSFLVIFKAAINPPRINLIGYVSCLKWQKASMQKPGLLCAVSRTQNNKFWLYPLIIRWGAFSAVLIMINEHRTVLICEKCTTHCIANRQYRWQNFTNKQ